MRLLKIGWVFSFMNVNTLENCETGLKEALEYYHGISVINRRKGYFAMNLLLFFF